MQNTNKLKQRLQANVASLGWNTPASQAAAAVIATSCLTTDREDYVETVADLPDLEITQIPSGHTVYVKDIGTFAVSLRGKWLDLDGNTLRTDYLVTALFAIGGNWANTTGTGANTGNTALTPQIVCGEDPNNKFCKFNSEGYTYGSVLAQKEDGTLWGWGNNACGKLGFYGSWNYNWPDERAYNVAEPRPVCAPFTDWTCFGSTYYSSHAVRANGTLWSWGYSRCGMLGNNTAGTYEYSPIQIATEYSDWCAVGTGGAAAAAIRTNGTLWTWGCNINGQLGDGTIECRSSPVQVLGGYTDWCKVIGGSFMWFVAQRTSGELWSWGRNNYGQLGINSTVDQCSPVQVLGNFKWCDIDAGRGNVIGIKDDGTLWGWGRNDCGNQQLGLNVFVDTNMSSPVQISGETTWCDIKVGSWGTFATKTDGSVWGFGWTGPLSYDGPGGTLPTITPIPSILKVEWHKGYTTIFRASE